VRDLLLEGLDGLLAHRARSFLSTLGILFGVAAVIGILSIGEGARREAELLIERLGVKNFQIKAREVEGDAEQLEEVARKSAGLSRRDQAALQAALPRAVSVGGLRVLEVTELVPRPKDPSSLRVVGADPAYLRAVGLELQEGRPLRWDDERKRSRVCLLGREARRQLFGAGASQGARIRLGDFWVTVVGTAVEPGSALSGARVEGLSLDDRSRDIILPLATVLAHGGVGEEGPELSEILVALQDQAHVEGHAAIASRLIGRLHRQQPDYELVVPLRLLEQSRAQQRLFNLVMGLIAGISLLVGGIGIMNIMLASVLERTREIGVRMAVGAAPRDILLLFLAESALISLVGGLMGVLAGFGISTVVAAFTGWATAVSLHAVLLATLISMAEGVLFGLIPARRAAQLPPAIAVRR